MVSKKIPLTSLKFRSDHSRSEIKGTRPTAPPSTIKEIFVMSLIHVCKKFIFFDTNKKIVIYISSLFVVSLVGDFLTFPKTYLARSDNLFNLYFVKNGWGWTLLVSVPFLLMTSYTLCCGDVRKLLYQHIPRVFIATFFWYFWTKIFNVIETSYGGCTVKGFHKKSNCLKAGHLWNGFDISGHAFILMYSSFVLVEEARPILKWETINEHLRNEMYDRSISSPQSINPLRNLTEEQMKNLKFLYLYLTPIIRIFFIGMTLLQLLWDVMLIATMLYYHRMIEKVISGIIAVLTWFLTYRLWYNSTYLPDPAGSGCFHYQRELGNYTRFRNPNVGQTEVSCSSARITQDRTTFMGMPLSYGSRSNSKS